MSDWNAERMLELGRRHAECEARGDLEGTMATLTADPVYEFHPAGLTMRGADTVRRFYSQFFECFIPMTAGYELLAEWGNESSVAQEYEIALDVAGVVERFRVIGILQAEGELLGGERIFASDRFVRLMAGALHEELVPIERQ